MTGTVTVYFNTGFNGVDIPASAAVLANASQKSYTDVYYMREDIDKPTIKIKDSYDNLCAVDYCAISTPVNGTSYFFAVPSALSKGVTLLTLDLDALLTMGGASNLNYISGWQERGHIAKADDKLFDNVASEDWVPSQPLHASSMTGVNITGTAARDLDIIISNIAVNELGNSELTQEVIEGIVAGEADPVMYFPSIKTVTTPTGFHIYDFDETQEHDFSLPNTGAFDPSVTNVKRGLQKLYSCGQLQLQASYQIPKEYVASNFGVTAGQYTNLYGIHGSDGLNQIPFEYVDDGYTPKNKKVFATYRSYVITNLGSGDMCTKDPADLYDGVSQYPSINIWSDPTSTGKPYARFAYIKGNPLQYADCVRGLQWANSQIVMEGASGSLWNSLNTSFSNQQLERNKMQNLFNLSGTLQGGSYQAEIMRNNAQGAVAGAGFGILGTITGIVGGGEISAADVAGRATSVGQNGINLITQARNLDTNLNQLNLQMAQAKGDNAFAEQQINQQINQNSIGLIKSNQVIAPTVSFTPEQNLGLYGYNKFVAYEVRKSKADLMSEDMYYQRYGYNGLHRPLTQQCFNERQYYNFVQAFDVNLKSSREYGLRVRTKAISQLNAGVRVWKVLPDASYYETN